MIHINFYHQKSTVHHISPVPMYTTMSFHLKPPALKSVIYFPCIV